MAFEIQKHYQDPYQIERERAYQYLASLGISVPPLDHPEDLFYVGVPADADTYDEYAAAIAQRIGKIKNRLGSLQTPAEEDERNFLAILSVNALAFSFNHKLPQALDMELTGYLAKLWGKSRLAELLKKIYALPPHARADFVLLSELGGFDKEEFRLKENERALEIENTPTASMPKGLIDIITEGTKAANTAKHLYDYLYNKADWQDELSERVESYDREIPNAGGEGGSIPFRDTLAGVTHDEVLDSIDRKTDIARLHAWMEKLPPGMREAVQKFADDEPLTATERKAKDRGLVKIKAWMGSDKPAE
jgi:hypothetical protein